MLLGNPTLFHLNHHLLASPPFSLSPIVALKNVSRKHRGPAVFIPGSGRKITVDASSSKNASPAGKVAGKQETQKTDSEDV